MEQNNCLKNYRISKNKLKRMSPMRNIWKIGLMMLMFVFATQVKADQTEARVSQTERREGRTFGHRHGHEGFKQFMDDKVAYLIKEMKLSEKEAVQFESIYRNLQKAKFELMRKYSDAFNQLRKNKRNNPNMAISDDLYLQAVESEYQLNIADAQLEQQYYEQFRKILSPKQLYEYLRAEKKFKRDFMKNRSEKNIPH